MIKKLFFLYSIYKYSPYIKEVYCVCSYFYFVKTYLPRYNVIEDTRELKGWIIVDVEEM
jgi:hypothetical protein